MRKREVETRRVDSLTPHSNNPRTHPKKQIKRLAKSISEFGFTCPLVVDEYDAVLAGHGRLEAAKLLGMAAVPVIVIPGLSNVQKRAYVLADNKLAEMAGYDRPALALELKSLMPLLADEGHDIDITGFEVSEVDSLLNDAVDREDDPADTVVEGKVETAVSQTGDLWILGSHRLVCGDARKSVVYRKLMGPDYAAMVFTDPPFNLRIYSIVGRGKIKHREFAAASGEMSSEEFTEFLTTTLRLAGRYSKDGSIHYCCMDWRHVEEMSAAGRAVYSEQKNLIVWVKTNAGQGSFYRSQHELIFVFKNGEGPHLNNFELGQHGRSRSNVWTYAGVNTFKADRLNELTIHPTVKPVALVADAMRDCSRRGDIVLDPFMGSGTTIVAAERVGRRAFGIEIDPAYVDAAILRWQQYAKRDAILEGTNLTYDEVVQNRSASKAKGRR